VKTKKLKPNKPLIWFLGLQLSDQPDLYNFIDSIAVGVNDVNNLNFKLG
jgi:hypothetical protein